MITATKTFLELADMKNLEQLNFQEDLGWHELQQQFLKMIDRYLEVEMSKPVESNIDSHEAGGQFRVAFPHFAVRGDRRLPECMEKHMEARKAWTDVNLYHGFPDCCEVHHDIETFMYFQIPLFYWQLPGKDTAISSIEDVAHHIGNWSVDAPAWYDWNRHEFVSNWIGTRAVRNYRPYDYQEANHFRYSDVAMAAYLGTGNMRYLDYMLDYANHWCDHIEQLAAEGKPIQCSILPEKVKAGEMGYSGARKDQTNDYKIFYNLVSDNTSYDISGHMLDLYWITGESRYLDAVRTMMDQFFDNGKNGRPAQAFSDGNWKVVGDEPAQDLNSMKAFITDCTYLARLALRHDLLTGMDRYRKPILEWAAQIDEKSHAYDQMMSNLMVAAHFYDGNAAWLDRAYAMALCTTVVAESNDEYHQCNWVNSRQGTKFLVEMLYQPILGGVEWGTRGNIPVFLLYHQTGQQTGLPEGISFRMWRIDKETLGFEAVNNGTETKQWEIVGYVKGTIEIADVPGTTVRIDPGKKVAGRFHFDLGSLLKQPGSMFSGNSTASSDSTV